MAAGSSLLIITVFTVLSVASVTFWVATTSINSISPVRWTVSFLLPAFMGLYGIKRGSLDPPAGVLAFFVGYVLTIASGSFCVIMIVFFLTSSRLTKWKKSEKMKFEAKEDTGTARNWEQVTCNGLVATIFSLLYLYTSQGAGGTPLIINPFTTPHLPTLCSLAVIGAIACCCGDTWASEIGSILGLRPILITTLRPVPRGTNGGVSWAGLIASTGGGLLIGCTYYITQSLTLQTDVTHHTSVVLTPQWVAIPLGTIGGLIGSLIDSLLGATLQYSGYDDKNGRITHDPKQSHIKHISGVNIISNSAVNLMSSFLTAIIIPILAHVLV